MSNPVITERKSNISTTVHARLPPDAYFLMDSEATTKFNRMKEHGYVSSLLSRLDMRMLPTLKITPEVMRITCNNDWLQKGVGKDAALANKPPDMRRRSDPGWQAVRDAYAHLPDIRPTLKQPITLSSCRAYAEERFFCSGGNFLTLGRFSKYYPRKGGLATLVPTLTDARRALSMCALNIPEGVPESELKPFKLVALDPDDRQVVKVSLHSDTGFLIGGKRETEKVNDTVNAYALAERRKYDTWVAAELSKGTYGMKDRFMRFLETEYHTNEWLWTFKGKTKADMYTASQIGEARLRFYVAAPAPLLMICQQAQQVLANYKRNMPSGDGTSSLGISLAKGGAEVLVAAMQSMLDQHGWASTNYGDDTWVFIKITLRNRDGRMRTYLLRFALDMSSFDMTIQKEVKAPFISVYADEMRKIDFVSGCLWEFMMTKRRVALTGTHVAEMEHGNPSGMNGVTEVNTMVEQDFVVRVKEALTTTRASEGGLAILDSSRGIDMDDVEEIIRDVGTRMGFFVKIEQASFFVDTSDIKETLRISPFLYLGYYFHVVVDGPREDVTVMADLNRTFAQVRYPKASHIKKSEDFSVHEAMRIGSIAIGLGHATYECAESVAAFRLKAIRHIESVLATLGDRALSSKFLFLEQSPWGLEAEPSLAGVLRVLKSDPSQLYLPRRNEEGVLKPIAGFTEVILENGATVWERTSAFSVVSKAQAAYLAQMGGDFKLGVQPSGGPVTYSSWGLPRFQKPKRAPRARTFQARAMLEELDEDDLRESFLDDDALTYDDSEEDRWSTWSRSIEDVDELSDFRPDYDDPIDGLEISQEQAEDELNDLHGAGYVWKLG